jgi:hypothetical protein
MIVKHVPMRRLEQSQFARLARYLTDTKDRTERIHQIRITNCQATTIDGAIAEVLATQHLNQTAKSDKTYHLLISFPSGEVPVLDVLRKIEDRVCAAVGLADHQRISALHHDTDHLHCHIAISKIHPITHRMNEPYRAYHKLGQVSDALEIEFGLQRTNHMPRRLLSEGKARDMELHSGIESLVTWIRKTCAEGLQAATSWRQVHQILEASDLELRERGNGFVLVAGDGTVVKASTVARALSKVQLERRLGPFEARLPASRGTASTAAGPRVRYRKRPIVHHASSALYEQYLGERSGAEAVLGNQRGAIREQLLAELAAAKRSNRLRRSLIRLAGGSSAEKRLLYSQAFAAYERQLQAIRERHRSKRSTLVSEHPRLTWLDWLQRQAGQGNGEAITALRARSGPSIRGRAISSPSPSTAGPQGRSPGPIEHVTKRGTLMWRVGRDAIRDDGERVTVSRNFTTNAIHAALCHAIRRHGNVLRVEGDDAFRKRVAEVSVYSGLNVVFSDGALEAERRRLQGEMRDEDPGRRHARHHAGDDSQRRPRAGREPLHHRGSRGDGQQPHITGLANLGKATRLYDLPSVSERALAGISRRRPAVLLPSDARNKLVAANTRADDGVRRTVPRDVTDEATMSQSRQSDPKRNEVDISNEDRYIGSEQAPTHDRAKGRRR